MKNKIVMALLGATGLSLTLSSCGIKDAISKFGNAPGNETQEESNSTSNTEDEYDPEEDINNQVDVYGPAPNIDTEDEYDAEDDMPILKYGAAPTQN